MSLADIFIQLFEDPEAKRQVVSYHPHAKIRAFNLATTSLRHIQKWYDRLSDIDQGVYRQHGNYYSDPQALGLISKTGTRSAILTTAGREFLNTSNLYYNDPARAEYTLNKTLYYGGHPLGGSATFLQNKQRNLYEFLRKCRQTPNTNIVLNNDRLLVMAEILSSFGSALEAFLLLDPADLQAFAELGEQGFNSLLQGEQVDQGYIDLARRIAGDYTRASVRRRNYLLSHLFLKLRANLISSTSSYMQLTISYPYANLLSERTAYEKAAHFTDDITIEAEPGGYVVALREVVSTPVPIAPAIGTIQVAVRSSRRRVARPSPSAVTHPRVTEPYFVEAPLTVEAEDYVERTLRNSHGDAVYRIGHTSAEIIPLSDGLLPGADILIRDVGGQATRYIEVKSSRGSIPPSIRLTAAEYARVLKCRVDNVPYDLYVVSFSENQLIPAASILSDFQQAVAGLTITDLLSMEIKIEEV